MKKRANPLEKIMSKLMSMDSNSNNTNLDVPKELEN
jgi:hypothetical protein